jgi:hypothetical protein
VAERKDRVTEIGREARGEEEKSCGGWGKDTQRTTQERGVTFMVTCG